MLDFDLIHADTELLRQHGAGTCVYALPHFDVGHHQAHRTFGVDANESIGRESGIAAELDRAAPLEIDGRGFHVAPAGIVCSTSALPEAACLMAARMRTYVAQRQMLPDMAALMSSSVGFSICASRAAADMIWPD